MSLQQVFFMEMEDEINILDYLKIINKHKKMIITLCFSTVLITMIISLLMSKTYESTAVILPPQEGSSAGNLSALLAATGAGGVFGGFIPAGDKGAFLAVLKSRTMADDIIDRFNLMDVYKAKFRDEARHMLANDSQISNSKQDGTIVIKVQSKDRKLSAMIANFYVSNLDKLTRNLSISKARDIRIFVEKRLAETKSALVHAEDELRAFQSDNKLIQLDAQAKAVIEGASALQAKIVELEIQLKVMESYATVSNPEVEMLKIQIKELKGKLNRMKNNNGRDISFNKAPDLGLTFVRLTREVKIQEAVFTLLTQQYEQAKISEAKDTPTIQVLDPAVPAERKCKPKIKLNIVISGMTSLFVGIFLSFFLEYLKRIKQL